MRLIRGDVAVDLDHIGEGYNGDYDPKDRKDKRLLRFDVSRKDASGHLGWVAVDDSSYCTSIPVETDTKTQLLILNYLMDQVAEQVQAGHSIKKLCERLSWVNADWLDR